MVGDVSLAPRALLLGVVFRGAGYIGVGALVALSARSLHRLAYQDILTGLPNRRAFFERLSSRLSEHLDVIVLACDVDDLKAINDRQGHAAGDAAICAVARHLVRGLGPCAFVARVGGDEFLAITQVQPPAELVIPGASLGTARRVRSPSTSTSITSSREPTPTSIGPSRDGRRLIRPEPHRPRRLPPRRIRIDGRQAELRSPTVRCSNIGDRRSTEG